jgi:PBP1b-binding outer membrane lipoprotein LpoB
MIKLASMLAVAAVALIAAGCGDVEEQNDYVDQVNALQTELVSEVTAVVSGTPPSNAQQAADVAGELGDVFNDSADDIEAVTPPEEVADLHAELVAKIRDIADQINAAEEAFTSGNAQEAAQAATELQSATNSAQTELNSLIDQINAEFGD